MSDQDNQNFVERFTVRMPDGMRDAIAERAKTNGRSMNSEIIQILQDAIDVSSGNISNSEDEVSRSVMRLRRHTLEQDMLLNEIIQLLNHKK